MYTCRQHFYCNYKSESLASDLNIKSAMLKNYWQKPFETILPCYNM